MGEKYFFSLKMTFSVNHFEEIGAWLQIIEIVGNSSLLNLTAPGSFTQDLELWLKFVSPCVEAGAYLARVLWALQHPQFLDILLLLARVSTHNENILLTLSTRNIKILNTPHLRQFLYSSDKFKLKFPKLSRAELKGSFMKVKNLAKDAIITLKGLKLEFEKFWTIAEKLCVGKPQLKRQAQPN